MIRAEVPDVIVGAGTVTDSLNWRQRWTPAEFVITPGLTRTWRRPAKGVLPMVPGVSCASVLGLEYGFSAFKFFPADPQVGSPR